MALLSPIQQSGVVAATAPTVDPSSTRTVIAPVPQTVATSRLDANAVPFSLDMTSVTLPPSTPSSAQPMMPLAQRGDRQSSSDAIRGSDEQSAKLSVADEASLKKKRLKWEHELGLWEKYLAALRGSAADPAVSYHLPPPTIFWAHDFIVHFNELSVCDFLNYIGLLMFFPSWS
jgi:hypothetical protein